MSGELLATGAVASPLVTGSQAVWSAATAVVNKSGPRPTCAPRSPHQEQNDVSRKINSQAVWSAATVKKVKASDKLALCKIFSAVAEVISWERLRLLRPWLRGTLP